MTLLSVVNYSLQTLVVALYAWIGEVPWSVVWQFGLVSIGQAAAFALAIRQGWNLRLKDGLDVRLPERDVGNALAALSKLDKEERLFSRDIVAVDMRLPDRLTVQLSEDAAKAREELFKDKKPKKKAGDA
jgi:cell division protein FtsQ